jgi:hypothetical protein
VVSGELAALRGAVDEPDTNDLALKLGAIMSNSGGLIRGAWTASNESRAVEPR